MTAEADSNPDPGAPAAVPDHRRYLTAAVSAEPSAPADPAGSAASADSAVAVQGSVAGETGSVGRGFGDPRVDAAMARLGTAGGRTAAEQVAEYEAVHRVLQNTLATIDDA